MIYFDNAATTYPKPEIVYSSLDKAQRELAFNAGRGQYIEAENAYKKIKETREYLINKTNAQGLIFTPSATHAMNLLIAGLNLSNGDIIYCSPFDHNVIARTLYAYSIDKGIIVKKIPLNEDHEIDLDKLKFLCVQDKPKAVICTHVSNVTGYILPVHKIGEIVHSFGGIMVVDGAQSLGLVPVDLKEMDIDYYVFAGHKTLYGPFGIGGILTNKANLSVTLYGGTGTDSLNLAMPNTGTEKYEPSSPNLVAIIGMYEGAKYIYEYSDALEHERELLQYAMRKLSKIDEVQLYQDISNINNWTGILSFNMEGYRSEDLAKILSDEFDICVRGGYHCAPFIHKVLKTESIGGTVRISFSIFNKKEEIDSLIDALKQILED